MINIYKEKKKKNEKEKKKKIIGSFKIYIYI